MPTVTTPSGRSEVDRTDRISWRLAAAREATKQVRNLLRDVTGELDTVTQLISEVIELAESGHQLPGRPDDLDDDDDQDDDDD